MASLDDVENVHIDEGVFKYIQIRVTDTGGNEKIIIRGHSSADYHADISDAVTPGLQTLGLF